MSAGRLQHLGERHLCADLGGSAPPAGTSVPASPETALPAAGQGPTRPSSPPPTPPPHHNARAPGLVTPNSLSANIRLNLKTDGFFA